MCWFSITDYIYNNPGQADAGGYYGKHMSYADYRQLGMDTIRFIYEWPYYKLFNPSELVTFKNPGGNADWYIYRLAETYLLRAEAYFWLKNYPKALEDINAVRSRANAPLAQLSDVSIDYVFDERGRELFTEEPRKTELTRVAYIMAQLNLDGYTLTSMSTKSWYYDRVIRCNGFYRNQVMNYTNFYKISPYHIYWPIPAASIIANSDGIINQNPGYPGSGNTMTPIDKIN